MSNTVVQYNGNNLYPAPKYSISHDYYYYGNGNPLNSLFTITLEGQFIAITGGVGGDYQTTDPNLFFQYNAQKVNELRKIFSEPYHPFLIADASGTTIIQCSPTKVDVDIPSDLYVNPINYTVTLTTPKLTSLGTSLDNEECVGTGLISAQDTISVDNISDSYITLKRTISAQGISLSTSDHSAYDNASEWCWYRLQNETGLVEAIIERHEDYAGISFGSAYVTDIITNGSYTDGTYSINANYYASTSDIMANYSVDINYADDQYALVNVTCIAKGNGTTFQEQLQSIDNYFTNPIQQIYNHILPYIPSDIDTSNYDVSHYARAINENEKNVQYNLSYYIGGYLPASLRRFTATISRNTNGNFIVSAKGQQSFYGLSGVSFSVPTHDEIMNHLHDKALVTTDMVNAPYISTASYEYNQDNTLRSWAMTIEGNEFSNVDGGVSIEKHITRSIDINSYFETINEHIIIQPASSLFYKGMYFDTIAYNSVKSSMENKVKDYIKGEDNPTPFLFSGDIPTNGMPNTVLNINEKRLGDYVIGYEIDRTWIFVGLNIDSFITSNTLPIKDINVTIDRTFDVHSYSNKGSIPGRQFGALFQNLKTTTNPTITVNISISFGRTGIDADGNRKYVIEELIDTEGSENFVPSVSVSRMSDEILKKVLNMPSLKIDKYYNPANWHLDSDQIAIVDSENDTWDPIRLQLTYKCTYTLLNMGYRA